MRSLPLVLLLLLPMSALAADRAAPPPSAANLVRYRPTAWQLPAAASRMGMRFDPETGEALPVAELADRGASRAALRRAAEASVRTRADGSRHAVLGAAFRRWTVVRTAEDGRLEADCMDDLEAAKKRVEATREVPR